MGSRRRRQGFDPESEGKKADYTVFSCDGNHSQVLLLLECKPPRSSAANDLLKLGNAMKDCMNEAIRAGADDLDIEVCGIVCAGAARYSFVWNRTWKMRNQNANFFYCRTSVRCVCHGFAVSGNVSFETSEYLFLTIRPYQL